jgi:hypothetical protein
VTAEPLDAARRHAAALGLENIAFVARDVSDGVPDGGPFDYVATHGVYSWVPAQVRDRLLAVIAGALGAGGVAYVSYNALPGCRIRGALRDVMRFHAGRFAEPSTRVKEVRGLVDFIARSVNPESAYGAAFTREAPEVARRPDHNVFHDDLSDENEPVLLVDFVAHAARHGLAYLGDASLRDFELFDLPEAVRARLAELADTPVERAQYLDFLVGRRFRETLLCASDVRPRAADRERVRGLCFVSSFTTEGEIDVASTDDVTFKSHTGATAVS